MAVSTLSFLRRKAAEERSRRVHEEAQIRATSLSTEPTETLYPGGTTNTPPTTEESLPRPPEPISSLSVEGSVLFSPEVSGKKLPSPSWDQETASLVEWFLAANMLPEEPFRLAVWAQVVDPPRFYAALWADIAAGPQSPRAPGLREDLHRLFGVCLETLWKRDYPMDTEGGRIK